jgi:hypothetical protein
MTRPIHRRCKRASPLASDPPLLEPGLVDIDPTSFSEYDILSILPLFFSSHLRILRGLELSKYPNFVILPQTHQIFNKMDSYSYDSTFALGAGPLAFDDDAFTYDVAGPSLSLYRELMDEEERLLEEEHNNCEAVELFSDAWLHRPASLLDELTAAGELDFLGEPLSAGTQDVSIAKEKDLLVKSIAGNDAPVV